MNAEQIKAKLDQLADYQAQLDVLEMDKRSMAERVAAEKQAKIDAIVTPEIRDLLNTIDAEYQQAIDDIEDEFAGKSEDAAKNRSALEDEIKAAVKELGASVKGTSLHAVWAKGRTSWDTKKLEGLMMVVPRLEGARTIGEPTVSLRKV